MTNIEVGLADVLEIKQGAEMVELYLTEEDRDRRRT